MSTMINRVVKAAMLDTEFYKEAEADATLTQEALMVVILVSVAGAVGSFIGGLIGGNIGSALLALVVSVITGVATYYIWAYVTFFVGTQLFNATADAGELLRVLGYASGPRALSILSFIPCVGGLAVLVGGIWSLVAGFIGVKEALDLDTTKTLITVVIGWVIVAVITLAISAVMGVGAIGLGAAGSLLRGR